MSDEREAPGQVSRWRDLPPGPSVAARVGAVFRRIPESEPLHVVALAPRRPLPLRRRSGGLRASWAFVALAFLLGGTSAVLAERGFLHWRGPAGPGPERSRTSAGTHPSPAVARASHFPVAGPTPLAALASPDEAIPPSAAALPAESPPPGTDAPSSPQVRLNRALDRAPLSPRKTPETVVPGAWTQPAVNPLGQESRLLASALDRFRRAGDAEGALALLDRYARDFPSGVLAQEASLARLDALLAVGRLDEAEGLLGRQALAHGGRDSELRLVRAELTARHDCAKAIHDFTAVLVTPVVADPWLERAWHGRAACRAQLNDDEGMRVDLRAYLARFPLGRFANEARRLLVPAR